MEKKARWVFVVTSILSTVAVAFLCASMGTEYWIQSYPTRRVDNNTEDGAKDVTLGDPGTKFKGNVHFGLFRGYKSLDHGLGVREGEIWIPDEVADDGLMDFGLWVSTVVFVGLSISMGLTSLAFSVLNASTNPIETITGPMGLYVWNSIAILFTLASMVLFLVVYFLDLRDNILSPDDIKLRWTSEGTTDLHFSFYLLVVAVVLFVCNILTVALSGVRLKPARYGHSMNAKAMDGVMMY